VGNPRTDKKLAITIASQKLSNNINAINQMPAKTTIVANTAAIEDGFASGVIRSH
jgi:hypothetical protein